jgi:hypothetical protein
MHIFGVFAAVAILLGTALAQADISQVFSEIPTCTESSTPSLLGMIIDIFSSKNAP